MVRNRCCHLLPIGPGVVALVVVFGFVTPATAQPADESSGQVQPAESTSTGEDDSTAATESGVADRQLAERLTSIFEQIEGLGAIEVSVSSGVVTLSGEVDDPTAHDTAEALAGKLEGTLYVRNQISVTTEVTERVSPAIQRAWEKLQEFIWYLPLFAVALVVLGIFWVLARWISTLSLPGKRLEDRPFVQNIIRQIISLVVFLVGVLFVLDMFGVTTLVGAVLGTAGVAGLALGFAFRDIAENYLASIILGVQQPFRKNDFIKVGDFEGKVVRMTTRETVLMTLSGNHVRVPNATVFKSPTYNLTRNPMRRFEFAVGLGVDEELGEAYEFGIQTLSETAGVSDEPEPFARVEQLADSTVQVSFFGWVDQVEYDWHKVKSESIRRVKNALDAAGIEMPEPIYRVRTTQYTSPEEADQKQQRAAQELMGPGMEVEHSADIDEQIDQDRAESEETDLLE
jgi:small-conductance mechanosensitive channel